MTEHQGRDIEVGDRMLFGDAWGAIEYRGPDLEAANASASQ